MVKIRNRTPLTILIAVVAVGTLFTFGFLLGGENLVQGNVSSLSLVENFRDLNCEAWNELAITRNGVVSVVGSGREGFNPTFSSSFQTLTITDGTSEVDFMHVRLLIECSGNFIKKSTATVVSGSMNFQLCGDPQQGTTVCFAGSDRSFQQLQGVATATQQFFNVPLVQRSLSDDQRVILFEGDISAFELERLFDAGDGTIHFKSVMFPILTWTFNHPTLGVFTASYNAITANDPVISQYGRLRVADIDTDGDGIFDLSDACINQPETVNGFQDEDGCPDTVPILDTDGDGILDNVDECVLLPENINGFQDADGCPDEIPTTVSPDTEICVVIDPFTGSSMIVACPTPTIDTDGDGVTDDIDLCIMEIGTVANLGCPEPIIAETPTQTGSAFEDDDGDGLINSLDACPNEFGLLIDMGCPKIIEPPVVPAEIPEVVPEEPRPVPPERLPVQIPPPLFDLEPVQQPFQPTTTITGEPTEQEEITFIILLLLVIGIIIIIIIAIVTKRRR